MLEPEAWSEVRLIHEAVLSLRVKMNGTTYTYRDICARWRGECYTNSILSFADIFAFLRHINGCSRNVAGSTGLGHLFMIKQC